MADWWLRCPVPWPSERPRPWWKRYHRWPQVALAIWQNAVKTIVNVRFIQLPRGSAWQSQCHWVKFKLGVILWYLSSKWVLGSISSSSTISGTDFVDWEDRIWYVVAKSGNLFGLATKGSTQGMRFSSGPDMTFPGPAACSYTEMRGDLSVRVRWW